MVSHTPQSALRSGKFGSRTHDDPDPNHNLISSGYNLQPLLDLTPSIQTKQVHVHHAPLPPPNKSKTVAFPSKDQEVTLERSYDQQQARPRKKDKISKLQTRGHGKSGCIQSRTGATPFVLQRWTNSYWLHVYPATLKIFESEEKMNQWKAMDLDEDYDSASSEESIPEAGDSGCGGSGKFKKGKHRLVLASINFDSQGTLKRKIGMFESKKNGKGNDNNAPGIGVVPESYNDGRYTKKTMVADEFANIGFPSKTFVMEEVRSKYYKRNGPLMHTCKITYCTNLGRVIEAAFGSTQPVELKKLRSVIRYCIRLVRKSSKSKKRKPRFADGTSVFSGMTKGAISAISTTDYGEATMTKEAMRRRKRRAR